MSADLDPIERRLLRVAPARLPSGLRERAIVLPRRRSSPEAWLPLVAVAASILLYALAASARGAALVAAPDAVIEAQVNELSRQLGGGPIAEYVARQTVNAGLVREARIE